MRASIELADCLSRIDGRGYKAYREIEGAWEFSDFTLFIDRVQSDPFAAPSKMRVRVGLEVASLPPAMLEGRVRRIASADFLARRARDAIQDVGPRRMGTGRGGLVSIDAGGQEVLERTAVIIGDGFIEARIEIGLPAAGRRVLGAAAADLLIDDLPRILRRAWIGRKSRVDLEFVHFVECVENQECIRASLRERGMVAFIGDGARLPRESGASERPMDSEAVRPFSSPDAFRVEFNVPNANAGAPGNYWRGMGVPRGVVLLVGGGYHGKSTLLRAIERGVVSHIPGDGRECVVADPALVKIRAEDGRAVTHVDIHGFIDHLPTGLGDAPEKNTHAFSTTDASGSTSQAANIIEAIEVGASGLLLDEDTSATNFMVRDARMQALVHPRDEPITPFVERIRELFDHFDVSTVLVMGGSGEYFGVADAVIELKNYEALDVTERAQHLAEMPRSDTSQTVQLSLNPIERAPLVEPAARVPDPASFDARRGRSDVKLSSRGCEEILFGQTEIDLRGLEQLLDPSQTRAIAFAMHLAAKEWMGQGRTLSEVLDHLEALIDEAGLDVLDPFQPRSAEAGGQEARSAKHPGALARPRRFEIAAAINRMRSLQIRSLGA